MGRKKAEEKQEDNFDMNIEEQVNNEISPIETKEEESTSPPEVDPTLAIDGTKRAEVENKESRILTSSYYNAIISNEVMKGAIDIKQALTTHLSQNYKINPGKAVKTTLPTGIDVLDAILGGGVATGISQFVGMPGSGKSAICAKLIATGQRKWAGKFNGIYGDTEISMTTKRLSQLGVLYPPLESFDHLRVENIFQIVEGMCTYKEQNPAFVDIPWVLVWDSIANTMTQAAEEAEDVNKVIGEKARLLAHLLPKYVDKINDYGIIMACVNQLRDKLEMGIFKQPSDLKFLTDKKIPGGKSLIFNSVQIILMKPIGDVKGEYGFNGMKILAKAVKNKLFSPNIEVKLIFSFERGFTNFWTNFELLKEEKRIKVGAWCQLTSCPSVGNFKQNQAIELYNTNPEFKAAYDKDVEEVIKETIIDANSSTSLEAV